MVVKTEICAFSEYRIYPGHGQKYFARDGRASFFISKKAARLHLRKVKAQVVRWTTTWRRHWKKTKADEAAKKKRRRAAKVQRAIVGLSLDEINRRRAAKPEERKKEQDAALQDIKARKKKLLDAKRGSKPSGGAKQAPKQAKVDSAAQKKATATAKVKQGVKK